MIINNSNKENNSSKFDVNTRSLVFYNKDGHMPSTLQLGFWNDMISVKMYPVLPESKRVDKKLFDYDNGVSTSISVNKAMALLKGIQEHLLPAIEDGIDKSISIIIKGDTALMMSTGVKRTGSVRPFLGLYKGLDEEAKNPKAIIEYEFNHVPILMDYDVENGSYVYGNSNNAELSVFITFLKASIEGLSHAGTHSSRYVDRAYKEKVLNDINLIGGAVGVETKFKTNKPETFAFRPNKSFEPAPLNEEKIGSLDDYI